MLIHKLKLYPNQSQGGAYAANSGGSGPQPTGNGYTPGGEYIDGTGADYVGAWHSHSNGVITKGTIQSHTDISNEDVLFPINTSTPNAPDPYSLPPSTNSATVATNNSIQGNSGIQLATPNTSGPSGAGRTGTNTPSNAGPLVLPVQFVPTGSVTSNAIYQQPPFIATNIQEEYIQNGITFKSNDSLVNNRNSAGNLVFEENSQNNQNLLIDSAIETYTNKSFIEAVNTQFNYFKFPAKIGVDSTLDLSFNSTFDLGDTGVDPVTSYNIVSPKASDGTTLSDYITTATSGGNPNPMRLIPFNKTLAGAPIDNDLSAFVLTTEKIKYIKESNKAIKITAAATHRPQSDINTGFVLGLSRRTPLSYRGWDQNAGPLYTNKYPYVSRTTLQQGGGSSQDHSNTYVYLRIDYVIDPDDMVPYDQYSVVNCSGNPAWYLRQSTRFQISLIDDPGATGYGKV